MFRRLLLPFVLLALASTLGGAFAQDDAAVSTGETETSPFDGMVFYCTKCMKEVPEQLGAGSECPHCGAFFESATNADGSETKVEAVGTGLSLRAWSAIGLVVLFGGEYLFRRWRRAKD